MSDVPQNFCTMFKDGEDTKRGLTDYWCEVCLDGKEPAAAMFYIQIPSGSSPYEFLKRIGNVLATTVPHDTALIADVIDPGWRDRPRPASAMPDDDFPF